MNTAPRDPLLLLDVDPARLQQLLKTEGKTIEQYQREIVERLRQWCDDRQGAIVQCLMGLPSDRLIAITGTSATLDFSVADAEAELVLEWADAGWDKVHMAQLPGRPSPEEMRDFLAFVDQDMSAESDPMAFDLPSDPEEAE